MLNEHHRRKPYINGIETIDYYQREYSSIPFIGQSTFFNFDLALQLMKRGTSDYSVNPVDREKLATVGADGMNIRQIKILRGIARRYPHGSKRLAESFLRVGGGEVNLKRIDYVWQQQALGLTHRKRRNNQTTKERGPLTL